eukprot:4820849-Alexandrium_andersonii.AAC.1
MPVCRRWTNCCRILSSWSSMRPLCSSVMPMLSKGLGIRRPDWTSPRLGVPCSACRCSSMRCSVRARPSRWKG